jgi:hypothetical protein
MTMILRALGATGVVAIYEGPDDAPFSSPLSHLTNGRLKFHSSLAYPKVISEQTGTIALPYRGTTGGEFTATYDLFAHGRGGQPWVLASLTVGGNQVAAVGSVPVQFARSSVNTSIVRPWARWISIGADSTHVRAFEYTVMSTTATEITAVNLSYTVWVTDELL